VRTIVGLGHSLDLEVIAEGVETPSQLAELREMGCDHGQGYLFAPPVEAAAARAMLHTV
jgi:EAL domain-containing protein (putative c-di-GMP-specific phosphodiesterase class I)